MNELADYRGAYSEAAFEDQEAANLVEVQSVNSITEENLHQNNAAIHRSSNLPTMSPSLERRTIASTNPLDLCYDSLPVFETYSKMTRRERLATETSAAQKGYLITVGIEAKMLRLNDRDQLTKKLISEWISTMRILVTKKTDINYVEWIHEDAHLYIGIRISAEYNQANLAKEWTTWNFAKLSNVLIRLWGSYSKDNTENSVESQLKALIPRITADNAFEHGNAWCGQVAKIVRDA